MVRAHVATGHDLDALAAVLGRAFADDPVMAYTFGEDGRCDPDVASRFFLADARAHARGGLCQLTDDGHGGAIWAGPGRWKLGIVQTLRTLPTLLRIASPSRLRRNLAFLSSIEAAHPERPHYYLAVLGTDPDHRGEGHGVAAMRPVFELADAQALGCHLESSKEENVPYYERHGFSVTGEIRHPGAPLLWSMWRDPRPR